MPILFKMAAVCDKCGTRRDYETEDIRHGGVPDHGRELLRGEDVEHVTGLPGGWKEVNISWGEYRIHCNECVDADAPSGRKA